MTRDETLNFLMQAQKFFTNYHQAMQSRLEGLHNGAVGDSRFVSAWISYVASENAKHSASSIADFHSKASPGWIHAWTPEVLYLFSQKPYPVDGQTLDTFAAKTADYLLRAQELLAMQLRNSDKGYEYIPVPPHKVEAERMQGLYNQLQEIKQQFDVFSGLKQQKSWLTDELVQASDFVYARVAMHGLPGALYPGQANKEDLEQRSLQAADDLKKLAHKNQERGSIELVKTTQKHTGSHTSKEKGSSAEHVEHLPTNMSDVMAQFKRYTQQKTTRGLKFDLLKEQLEAEFPTPKVKLT